MSISLKRIKALTKKELKSLVKNQNVLIMSLLPIFFGILYANLYSNSEFMNKIMILIMCVNMNLLITDLMQSDSLSFDKFRSITTILIWIVLSIVAFLFTYKKVGVDR